MSLFVIRFHHVDHCGECPEYVQAEAGVGGSWFDECGRTGKRVESRGPIPDWCPYRAGAHGTDFTDVPHEVLADLLVAIDRQMFTNGSPPPMLTFYSAWDAAMDEPGYIKTTHKPMWQRAETRRHERHDLATWLRLVYEPGAGP